jgi:hypothetical protein
VKDILLGLGAGQPLDDDDTETMMMMTMMMMMMMMFQLSVTDMTSPKVGSSLVWRMSSSVLAPGSHLDNAVCDGPSTCRPAHPRQNAHEPNGSGRSPQQRPGRIWMAVNQTPTTGPQRRQSGGLVGRVVGRLA